MLGTEQSKRENKPALDVLDIKERRLDAARFREANAMKKITNFMIANSNALHEQAASFSTLITVPVDVATTLTTTTSTAQNKIMKRELSELRDGWKDSAGKLHRAHLDAMPYHKTSSKILWHMMDIVHQHSSPSGSETPTPGILLAKLVLLVTLEDN